MVESEVASHRRVSRSVVNVSLCTFLSRVLGLLRDSGMAAQFGNGPLLDAFTVAFRIPNLARALLGEGALATAFLPAYLAERTDHGISAANRLVTATILILSVVLSGLIVVVEAVLLAVLWSGDLTDESSRLVWLLIYLMPYVGLICLTAQFGAILQAEQRFVAVALLPAAMNLLWLICLWWIVPLWNDAEDQLYVMASCVLACGLAQFLTPWPLVARLGFHYVRDWRLAMPRVRQLAWEIVPVIGGLMITQINLLFDSAVAWGLAAPEGSAEATLWWGLARYPLESGTASAMFLGHRLYQFPLGVFGVALGTVLYPLFARHAQARDYVQLREDYSLGMRYVAAIGIPASCGLCLLSQPVATLFFEYGAFDDHDALQTSHMIAGYGIAVWAHCGISIMLRGFYALGDRLTPMRVGILTVGVNVLLNLLLLWWLGGVALALATSMAAAFQCLMLGWLFEQKLGGWRGRDVLIATGKAGLASLAMSLAGLAMLTALEAWPGLLGRAGRVAGPLVVSVAVYLCAARLLRFQEPFEVLWHRKSGDGKSP
ncbi:murein biosynthesis integral membrane protein MurJ [bacterium]|nr:murein biosynthesis integral membrane protein MurJ [bacterium]